MDCRLDVYAIFSIELRKVINLRLNSLEELRWAQYFSFFKVIFGSIYLEMGRDDGSRHSKSGALPLITQGGSPGLSISRLIFDRVSGQFESGHRKRMLIITDHIIDSPWKILVSECGRKS